MKIGIVGAGILGRLLAFKLKTKDEKLDILLFDKNEANDKSPSFVAAGMLSPFCELSSSEKIIADLGCESIEIWKKDIKKIQEISEKKIFFRQNGTLVIAHRQDIGDLKIFRRNIDLKLSSQEQPYDILSYEKIYEVEPNLERKFYEGMLFPNDGQIDPKSLMECLQAALEKLDVRMFYGVEIKKIDKNSIDGEKFDAVFDCRGVDSQVREIRGVRGEIITFEMKNFELKHCIRLIHPRFPLYIAPRDDGIFVIGATQIDSEDKSNISIRSTLEMLTAVFSINSQFGEARIIDMQAQLRPAFPDNLPKIIHDGSGNFILNGLYRHGFLISPKIIEIAMKILFKNEIDSQYSQIIYKL